MISIIVPVYNVEKYLNRCIDSLIEQNFNDYELILVNDGSTDHSIQICEEYLKKDNRIKLINKLNGGLSSARNAGLDIARGQYITFVDSDDWVESDYLSYLYTLITRYNADFVMAENIRLNNKEFISQPSLIEKELSREDFLKLFFKINTQKNVQYSWAKLYKRELFDDVRFPDGLIDEDVPTTFLLSLKCEKIIYSNKIVYDYFINPKSITTSSFSDKTFDLLKVWDIVVQNAEKSENNWIIENAKINRARADFGILMNYAFSKQDSIYVNEINKCLKSLKQNRIKLLKSKIPISRKFLIIQICISYKGFLRTMKIAKGNR